MPDHLFISHAPQDQWAADALYNSLESQGFQCWTEAHEPPVDFVEDEPIQEDSLVQAIEAASWMVLVFSAHTNTSPQVEYEVGLAFERELPLISVRLDNSEPSRQLKEYLRNVVWLDAITPPFETQIETITDQLKALPGVTTSPTLFLSPPPSEQQIEEANQALQVALKRHRLEAVFNSILSGANQINICDRDHWTPLHYAVHLNRVDIVHLLLERGADTEEREYHRYCTPFDIAVECNNVNIARLLLEHGAKIEGGKGNGKTPLHTAAHFNNWDIARYLLERGADIEAKRDGHNATPLLSAILGNSEDVVRLLLEHGANVEAKTTDGYSPLTAAKSLNNQELVKLLVKFGAAS